MSPANRSESKNNQNDMDSRNDQNDCINILVVNCVLPQYKIEKKRKHSMHIFSRNQYISAEWFSAPVILGHHSRKGHVCSAVPTDSTINLAVKL
jgi:hypothetical protein